MVSPETRSKYLATIGIECHVQLKTKTKLFAAVGNDAREAPPNTLISHICLGMPGALPVLNKEAVHLACKAAFALGVRPQTFSKFDRKHYFYPDLPKGYQITQFDQPIIVGGEVTISSNGEIKKINVTRAHLEEDAGKSTHPTGKDYSLVDLNRAGTPLLEIVSEPEMHSSEEAKAYAKELYLLMKYADVSEANLYYGNMRFDVNVSVSVDKKRLGTRSETKNLNSFKSVERAVDYEIDRQIELLEAGKTVVQETRGWDDAKQRTFSQRTKEDAHDYRYFPDPDIPPVVLEDVYISGIEAEMPIMPSEWRGRLNKLGLDEQQVTTLIDAEVESAEANYLPLIDQALVDREFAKTLVNWLINVEIPARVDQRIESTHDNAERLQFYRSVFELTKAGKLSSTNAKALIVAALLLANYPPDVEKYATEQGYIQVSDENAIMGIVNTVLEQNQKAADDVRGGEEKAIGFLVGEVMKASRGKANPGLVQELIRKQLGI